MNPMLIRCPACQAGVGQPCTQPTETGRRAVRWLHIAREATRDVRTWEHEEKGLIRGRLVWWTNTVLVIEVTEPVAGADVGESLTVNRSKVKEVTDE